MTAEREAKVASPTPRQTAEAEAAAALDTEEEAAAAAAHMAIMEAAAAVGAGMSIPPFILSPTPLCPILSQSARLVLAVTEAQVKAE